MGSYHDMDKEALIELIADQQRHIDSLQDRWANRPLDHPSGEALIVENDRLIERIGELEGRLAEAERLLRVISNDDCEGRYFLGNREWGNLLAFLEIPTTDSAGVAHDTEQNHSAGLSNAIPPSG